MFSPRNPERVHRAGRCDDSEASLMSSIAVSRDHREQPMDAVVVTLTERQQRDRDRKRRGRHEHKSKLQRMREQVAILEAAAAAVATVSAEDAAWDDFLDDDAKRMRSFLRTSLCLTQDAQQLTHEQTVLQKLLREHDLWTAAARALLVDNNSVPQNDWTANVRRWHALNRAYFTPWTLAECQAVVDAALFEMHQFVWRSDTTTSGLSILGWHDERRFDRANASIQFCFHKTFRNCDLLRHTQFHWDVYTRQEVYQRIVLGNHALSNLEVLQHLTPNMWIVRYVERYDGDCLNVHVIYLVFRQALARGFLLCLRSIACPDIQRATDSDTDCWGSDSIWIRWELLDGKKIDDVDLKCTDYLQTIGGSITGEDLSYANRWLFEALAAVIRAEVAATNKQYLQF